MKPQMTEQEPQVAFESSPQPSTADERWSGVDRRAGGSGRVTKVVVLGNSAIGKTSIIRRFVKGEFLDKYRATIGADFQSKHIKLPPVNDHSTTLTLQIWDTGGQERWKALSSVFFRGADACVVVCAVDDRDSLMVGAGEWLEEFRAKQGTADGPVVVMAVSKTDMSDWQFTKEEVDEVADKLKVQVKFVSALTGEGVEDLFGLVAAEIVKTPPDITAADSIQPISLDNPQGGSLRDCISASCRSC
jgi:small GTP-binding protein